jgi:hypothetical protein
MATTKIWNISDGPNPDVTPQNVMVMGKLLKPGQALMIEEGKLKNAHKVKKEAAAGLLHIGKKAPADYLMLKHPEHRKIPPGATRSQGKKKTPAAAPPPPKEVKEEVKELPKPDDTVKDPEPSSEGGGGGGGILGRRKKHRG